MLLPIWWLKAVFDTFPGISKVINALSIPERDFIAEIELVMLVGVVFTGHVCCVDSAKKSQVEGGPISGSSSGHCAPVS